MRRSNGWTLIEVMIGLALAGLALAIAVPGYHDWVAIAQVGNQAQQLAGGLTQARSEALRRGTRVTLCPAADGRRCADAATWDTGWLMYVDANRDGQSDDTEPVLRQEGAAAAGIRVAANRPVAQYVSFTPLGQARLHNGGLQMGTFTVCRRGLPAQKVVLANSGRVRVEKTRDVCAG